MDKKKITFIVPVCSRGRSWKNITDVPLINTCFKSIQQTILLNEYDKYSFHIKFGYDDDDAFFSTPGTSAGIAQYIAHESKHKITASAYSFDDTKHNPVRCWNHLAKLAVDEGADYLYQTGDDVELLTPGWAPKFIAALETTDNIGIAAPKDVGYHGLYTQSFVHRTHIEIMGAYYDPEFTNIYCDDFLTGVYKPRWNHYLEEYTIQNTGGACRYHMDDAQPKLISTVANGQKKLYNHIVTHYGITNSDDSDKIILDMRSVHTRYEEISKTMTTAPAKPYWSTATQIFDTVMSP